MDTLSPLQRSERMAQVRRRDTRPELVVRRLVVVASARCATSDPPSWKYAK
ncbi:hypothetical protein JQK88_31760 [Mesorhizobium caraganae]|nr:hypothetical protein [Mesorhizobium caraganae]